jgi:hypothetical protein
VTTTEQQRPAPVASEFPVETAARLRRDVEKLVGFDRRTVRWGERESARFLAARLTEIGTKDITTTTFRTQSSWAPAHLAYLAVGADLALLSHPAAGGRRGTCGHVRDGGFRTPELGQAGVAGPPRNVSISANPRGGGHPTDLGARRPPRRRAHGPGLASTHGRCQPQAGQVDGPCAAQPRCPVGGVGSGGPPVAAGPRHRRDCHGHHRGPDG